MRVLRRAADRTSAILPQRIELVNRAAVAHAALEHPVEIAAENENSLKHVASDSTHCRTTQTTIMSTENVLGRIEISPTAVATIAATAVTQAYGVVGLAAKNATDQLIGQLTGEVHRGVDVRFVNNEAVIDLYVIIEYGTRIVSVAHSVQNLVKFNVEKALGLPVASINVHVQGLRVSDNGE
jgi:uncharacterized alkaline shock family protein YloU